MSKTYKITCLIFLLAYVGKLDKLFCRLWTLSIPSLLISFGFWFNQRTWRRHGLQMRLTNYLLRGGLLKESEVHAVPWWRRAFPRLRSRISLSLRTVWFTDLNMTRTP